MSDFEVIWWVAVCIVAYSFWFGLYLPWNDRYDPKGNDPYRYCPKEEEEYGEEA